MEKEDNQHKLKLIEDLKKASRDLLTTPIPLYTYTNLATIKSFFELETQLDPILSNDPTLIHLSQLVSNLKTQLTKFQNSQGYSLKSLIRRQIANYEISNIVASIEAEVQAWVDQERIKNLVQVLLESNDEEENVEALTRFEKRVSSGFDRDLQEIILKAKVFPIIEAIFSRSKCSPRIFEQSGRVIVALVRFNKDVFVGQVLMGPIIRALVSMPSRGSIQILSSLIKLVKSPLVYEMEANGFVPKITRLLNSRDLSIQVAGLECVLELALFTTREAIEAMIQEGLIKKLVELQRLEEIEGDLIEVEGSHEDGGESRGKCEETEEEEEERELERRQRGTVEDWPFTSCVTRFVVQLEMGEGLELGEKRELKQEILRRVREASVSDAEATTIVAEVLWGSSPLLH